MNTRSMLDQIPTENEIRAAIDGYFTLYPATVENKYYDSFKRGWLNLQCDLEKYNAGQSSKGFMIIMDAARNQRDELYERCSLQLQETKSAFQRVTTTFEKFHDELEEKGAMYLIHILRTWQQYKDQYAYALCINLTKKALVYSKCKKMRMGEPFGTYENFIREAITMLEEGIDKISKYYAMHLGISSAMTCYMDEGELPKCKDYVLRDWQGYDFSLEQHKDKTIRNLLNMGHLVDTATKLRFLSLVDNDGYSHQEAYDIIVQELDQIGFDYNSYLPEEAKTLSDRARRYRDKIYEELSSLNKNLSVLSK